MFNRAVGAHPSAEGARDRLGQQVRSADDVPRQAAGFVPHELEVADAVAGRDLLWLAGGAPDGGAEYLIDAVGHPAKELRERFLVAEAQDADASVGV